MFYRQQNECHEIDDERAGSVIGNLSRDPRMLRKNPYYNKTQIKTDHAVCLDKDSLFKMGQVSEYQMNRGGDDGALIGEEADKDKVKSRNRFLQKYQSEV